MSEVLNINLYDDIKPEVARDIAAALLANPGSDVVLRINSPGGSVTDGYAIANALRTHVGNKVAVIEGVCASAATFPACACDEIHMHSESLFMIHSPWGEVSGKRDAMDAQGALLDKMAEQCIGMYQRKSGADAEQVRAWLAADTWMTPQEAQAAGFCDKILSDAPPPSARVNAQRYMARLRAPKAKEKASMATEKKMPEHLAKELAKYGWDDNDPMSAKAAFLAYMAKTEDGPAKREEMAKAMASVEAVDGPDGDEGQRTDNPITTDPVSAKAKKDDEEDSSADLSEKMKAKLNASAHLDPAVQKLITDMSKSHSKMAQKVELLESAKVARDTADYQTFALARVSKADADEYLALAKGNIPLATTLVSKFPVKGAAMNKMTRDGRPVGASAASPSEAEAAPMSGRHQLR